VFIASTAVKENHPGLALNDRYQLIVCADNANLLDKNIDILAKNAQMLYSLARRFVQKNTIVFALSPVYWTLSQYKAFYKYFEHVANIKYLVMTLTRQIVFTNKRRTD
jgi:hypothetical protein